jgi:hypothetical protein
MLGKRNCTDSNSCDEVAGCSADTNADASSITFGRALMQSLNARLAAATQKLAAQSQAPPPPPAKKPRSRQPRAPRQPRPGPSKEWLDAAASTLADVAARALKCVESARVGVEVQNRVFETGPVNFRRLTVELIVKFFPVWHIDPASKHYGQWSWARICFYRACASFPDIDKRWFGAEFFHVDADKSSARVRVVGVTESGELRVRRLCGDRRRSVLGVDEVRRALRKVALAPALNMDEITVNDIPDGLDERVAGYLARRDWGRKTCVRQSTLSADDANVVELTLCREVNAKLEFVTMSPELRHSLEQKVPQDGAVLQAAAEHHRRVLDTVALLAGKRPFPADAIETRIRQRKGAERTMETTFHGATPVLLGGELSDLERALGRLARLPSAKLLIHQQSGTVYLSRPCPNDNAWALTLNKGEIYMVPAKKTLTLSMMPHRRAGGGPDASDIDSAVLLVDL